MPDIALSEQLAWYASHPPRLLAPWCPRPVPLPNWVFDGHGHAVNVAFVLACLCGSEKFDVSAHFDEETEGADGPHGPVGIDCPACDASGDLFDPDEHGYDAEMGLREKVDPGDWYDGIPSAPVAPPYRVIVRLEYALDQLGAPDFTGREQDLFSWITILGQDAETGALVQLFEEECA